MKVLFLSSVICCDTVAQHPLDWRQADRDVHVATSGGEYAGFAARVASGFTAHGPLGQDLGFHATIDSAQRAVVEWRESPSPTISAGHPRLTRPRRIRRHGTIGRTSGPKSRRKDTMATGTVKWFNSEKGYGFIAPDDGSADLFAHYSAIAGNGFKELRETQKVEYDAEQGPKGMQAANIRAL